MTYAELKNLVKYHCNKYYNLNNPEISDEEFDALYNKLLEIEHNQGWAASDSPTLLVGGSPGKIKHPFSLYSLKKVYNIEEVDPKFKIKTPKLDGANLSLIYENNKLVRALTRGNGEFGEDVSHLMNYIAGIPFQTNSKFNYFVVNGECVTDNSVDNFRNYVSGALGLKHPEEFKTRNIRFISHELLGIALNYSIKLKLLQNMNFHTVLDEICSKYPQDGVVYRLDSYEESEQLGYTSKYPRFAVALKKREDLTATTTLKDVVWVVGRTGTVNPTGIVEPVELDGAIISRVTLHNLEFIESHDLGLGDLIQIERAGGVIPKFNRVLQHSKHNLKIKQRHAEECLNTSLQRVGPKLFVCGESQHSTIKLLEHFIKVLEIKGLGKSSINTMRLTHPLDLYNLNDWTVLGANGDKICSEINRSKTKPYETVLAALGIPGIGLSTARNIVKYLPSFNRLREIETVQIKGVGPKTIQNLLVWLDNNEEWVYKLPLQLQQTQSIDLENDSYEDKKVCITGKLDMTRNDLSDILIAKGFTITNTVTKDCYALISAGDTSSSKYKKATTYNIKIVDYWKNKTNVLKGNF